MEIGTSVADSVRALEKQYAANEISLNALVQRSEALLEQSKSVLAPGTHQRAMNCIYVVEEINALVLDEGRLMRDDEQARVKSELQRLSSLIALV